jgi:branched-chain amino acid transport system substrate-binding protein
MGTYNSGCAKLEVPILNQDPAGPMLMVSHANTNPGLTKAWDPGEPDKYYPTGVRNYGRIIATDDFQGKAGAQFASKELHLKNCYVLNDAQTYGQGVAKAFVDAAPSVGITIIANDAWDSKQTNYTALFEKVKSKHPDCVYLGGINDNNGQQLIKDKVKVLGPNSGAVKLVAPDGFTGYPELHKMPEAQDMYISFAGIPAGELVKQGGFGGTFRQVGRHSQECHRGGLLGHHDPRRPVDPGQAVRHRQDRRRDRQGHVLQRHEEQQRAVPQAVAARRLRF